MTTFDQFFERATGCAPYRWQRTIAQDGLPETMEIPTGCGKTLAVVMAWLYRRRIDPGPSGGEPRRLVFTLPMRTLVEQTRSAIDDCLERLDLTDDVLVATLMGGEPASDEWRTNPERDGIIVCTLDMGLSGALNRAYGSSRYTWPVTFGVLSSDTHWVFDEVQLMGPAAATSRQLHALRASFGTAAPSSSTWMSATLDLAALRTVDAPEVGEPVRLEPGEEPDSLMRRLRAPRHIERWLSTRAEKKDVPAARAAAIAEAHVPGTLTLAVVNTVKTARALRSELAKEGTEAVLLHSRFRPPDRTARLHEVLSPPGPEGRIVVATQVVEAGIDLSSRTLFTEVAPWASIVQRAGRCNRAGEVQPDSEAAVPRVLWDAPVNSAPYEEEALASAREALESVTGSTLSTSQLAEVEVEEPEATIHQVLRRADLVRLFDTTPDLAGNDLDISPYIRDGDDLDVRLCWRDLGPDNQPVDDAPPSREELCPVPVGDIREWLKDHRVMRLEYLSTGVGRRREHRWVTATRESVRPGQIYLASRASGGYTASGGWDPKRKEDVVGLPPTHLPALAPTDEAMGDDPATFRAGRRVSLDEHLDDVGREVTALLDQLGRLDLPANAGPSAVAAGRLHDLGKAHAVFQAAMERAMDGEAPAGGPWAKSGTSRRVRHDRPYFRHELASALALLGDASSALPDGVDPALATYLVAAHHGRVRMAIRSMPDEQVEGELVALGVHQDDTLDMSALSGIGISSCTLDLSPMTLGSEAGSWVKLASTLRDRPDLGLFRLAYLEAIVRIADWRASASYEERP